MYLESNTVTDTWNFCHKKRNVYPLLNYDFDHIFAKKINELDGHVQMATVVIHKCYNT